MIDNWKVAALSPTSTIRKVLEVIDNHALRIALIVDSDDILKGVVTDGDVRRGLLNGKTLNSNVSDIMTLNPFTCDKDASREELVHFMNNKNILAVPITDKGKVTGLATIDSENNYQEKIDNPVLIMAGGFGKRLRPLTDNCPKPMLEFCGKPLLETILLQFKKFGFSNFYISLHYLPEQIINYFGDGTKFGVNIKYVHEKKPLGTGGCLGLLPKDLDQNLPVIVCNGDILTTIDFRRLLEFHNDKSATSTICVREYEYKIPYGVISGKDGLITNMAEKPSYYYFVNAGIYCISPKIINSVDIDEKIDLPTILKNYLTTTNNKTLMFPIHEYWLDIGSINDFNRAQQDAKSLGLIS